MSSLHVGTAPTIEARLNPFGSLLCPCPLFVSSFCRPKPYSEGECPGCAHERDRLNRRLRTCGRLWREKIRGVGSDDEDEGGVGSGASGEAGEETEGGSPFGLAGRNQAMPVEPHSCGMGVRSAWAAPPFLSRGQRLPMGKGIWKQVQLEVVARVAACASVNGTWQACFPVDCALAVPAAVQPWIGKELRFQGSLEIQGYRESRRRQPSLTWLSSGRYRRFGLPSGVELRETRWVASVG